jgi:prophage maintenance system killer protein
MGEIVLYRAADGGPALDVRLERDTVWLSQAQLVELFQRDQSVISRHVRNVFAEGELPEESNMQKMHIAGSDKPVIFYNLDVIISVGYRVKSQRGTQFRIWATNVLRQHLVQGYTVHAQRLKELNQAVRLVADVAHRRTLSGDEATALLEVVADYAYALEVLDDYDHQRVRLGEVSPGPVATLALEEARQVIARMGDRFGASGLFGREKDDGLEGSLLAVMQTFDGQEVYPSLEEKAAHLLYFLVKNHHFVDGNKRIAAALFLWFLQKNQALYRADGGKRIADNALVAMTLLIAESRPDEKSVLTRVVVNLINRRNP